MVTVQNFQKVNSLIPKHLKQFFKTLYEVTASTNKLLDFYKQFVRFLLLLKSGIRKDVAVSVNKETMNKCSSKKYLSGFSFSLYYTF